MTLRKARLGEGDVDFSPVRGADALSLTTRLTVEGFSLAGVPSSTPSQTRTHVRFVPRVRT